MKVFGKLLRSILAPVFGVAAMSAMMTGCGDATDPTAVGLDELKFSYGLNIVDKGNGTVSLTWGGANNEDGFSGYNIYGAKDNADVIALDSKTIKLLNDKGEEDPTGKATLGKMGYNGENWETAGGNTNPDGDFAVYPYNTSKNGAATGGDAVLPSCMPAATEGAGVACNAVAADGATHIFNGTTTIDMTGLKIGSTYCFTTLSTLDSGKKVAQTTSEVRCVVPRAKVEATANASGLPAAKKAFGLDLEALRAACAAGTCGDLKMDTDLRAAATTSFADESESFMADESSKGCNATTTVAVCVEYFTGKPNFTAGANSGIQDLGYYANGFDDSTLPPAPKLSSFSDLQNKDGYSVSGQSLPIEANHVYVVANGVEGTENFYYHLIYVGAVTNDQSAGTASFPIEVRVSNKTNSF